MGKMFFILFPALTAHTPIRSFVPAALCYQQDGVMFERCFLADSTFAAGCSPLHHLVQRMPSDKELVTNDVTTSFPVCLAIGPQLVT